jgi:hypothetical protein
VLERLGDEHRWTIKDLIYYMVTEEPEKKFSRSAKKRARDISTAIFENKEVTDVLSHASDHLRDYKISDMAMVFQKELCRLGVEPGLGEFNVEIEPQNLNISGLASRAKDLAPGLWRFMRDIIGSSSTREDEGKKSSLFMICMMLAHLKAPRKNGCFHNLLGLHLHSMGVKGRVINLLASLGITPTYPTILTHSKNIAKIASVSQRRYTKPYKD